LQSVAHTDLARSFGRLLIALDSAEIARLSREGSRFEESRRPQPFVDSYTCHDSFSYADVQPRWSTLAKNP
jgi:hypothetical protein